MGWFDPPYNIATGLAWTLNCLNCVDLTPDEPLLKSTAPGSYHTWRYSHWIMRADELWAYAEVACPNDTNEIRLYRLPLGSTIAICLVAAPGITSAFELDL